MEVVAEVRDGENRTNRTAVRRLGEAAERASCWLWNRRDEQTWGLANRE